MSKSILILFDTLSLKKQKNLLAFLQDRVHQKIEENEKKTAKKLRKETTCNKTSKTRKVDKTEKVCNDRKKDDVDRDDDEWECEGIDVFYHRFGEGTISSSREEKCKTIVCGGERYCEEHIRQKPAPTTKEQLDQELDEYSAETYEQRAFEDANKDCIFFG